MHTVLIILIYYHSNVKKEALVITDLENKELWKEIERLRGKLHEIASKNGMRSLETIRVSQTLDNLINRYCHFKTD